MRRVTSNQEEFGAAKVWEIASMKYDLARYDDPAVTVI
jgi:hypothetical protein